jgi:hypothetical protein
MVGTIGPVSARSRMHGGGRAFLNLGSNGRGARFVTSTQYIDAFPDRMTKYMYSDAPSVSCLVLSRIGYLQLIFLLFDCRQKKSDGVRRQLCRFRACDRFLRLAKHVTDELVNLNEFWAITG